MRPAENNTYRVRSKPVPVTLMTVPAGPSPGMIEKISGADDFFDGAASTFADQATTVASPKAILVQRLNILRSSCLYTSRG